MVSGKRVPVAHLVHHQFVNDAAGLSGYRARHRRAPVCDSFRVSLLSMLTTLSAWALPSIDFSVAHRPAPAVSPRWSSFTRAVPRPGNTRAQPSWRTRPYLPITFLVLSQFLARRNVGLVDRCFEHDHPVRQSSPPSSASRHGRPASHAAPRRGGVSAGPRKSSRPRSGWRDRAPRSAAVARDAALTAPVIGLTPAFITASSTQRPSATSSSDDGGVLRISPIVQRALGAEIAQYAVGGAARHLIGIGAVGDSPQNVPMIELTAWPPSAG